MVRSRVLGGIGAVLVMFGTVALLAGILFTIFTYLFVGGATSATGTVTGFSTDKGISYPVIQFPDTLAPVTFTATFSSTNEPYKVGDKVAVLFNPETPTAARVNSFFSLWYFPVFLLIAGGVLLLVGGGLLFLTRQFLAQQKGRSVMRLYQILSVPLQLPPV